MLYFVCLFSTSYFFSIFFKGFGMIGNWVHCLRLSLSNPDVSNSNLNIETVDWKVAMKITTARSFWWLKILNLLKLIYLFFFSLTTIYLRKNPGDIYGFGIMGGNKVGIYIKDIKRRILYEIHNIKDGWKIISVIFFFIQVPFFIYILWVYFLPRHFVLYVFVFFEAFRSKFVTE